MTLNGLKKWHFTLNFHYYRTDFESYYLLIYLLIYCRVWLRTHVTMYGPVLQSKSFLWAS